MRHLFVASALALIAAMPASATVFTFSVVNTQSSQPGNLGYVASYHFSIDDAAVTFIDGGYYTEVDGVETTAIRPAYGSPAGDLVYQADYQFYTGSLADYGGGFSDGVDYAYFSDQLFSGSTDSPTFLTGTYSLYNDPSDATPLATLTIASDAASAAVPEPASWAMMIGGFGMVGGALRRRRVAVSWG